MMNYSEIVILLGNRCTAECEMCCLDASINGEKVLNIDLVKKFIISAKDLENIRVINFSGGEAFLYYEDLIELIKCCKSINRYSTVITNGFWAIDSNTTFEKMQALKQAGLGSLGLSYDQFHKKYINIENIKRILRVAKNLDMRISIQSVMIKGDFGYKWIEELGNDLVDTSINFMSCDPVGRAIKYLNCNNYIREKDLKGCICRKGGTFCISFDGRVLPCCSPFVFTTSFNSGNIYQNITTVRDALNCLEDNLILKVMRNKGFDFFVDIVKKNNLMRLENKVISSCEICSMLFNEKMIHKLYPYIIEKLDHDPNCKWRRKYEL